MKILVNFSYTVIILCIKQWTYGSQYMCISSFNGYCQIVLQRNYTNSLNYFLNVSASFPFCGLKFNSRKQKYKNQRKKIGLRMHLIIIGTYRRLFPPPLFPPQSEAVSPRRPPPFKYNQCMLVNLSSGDQAFESRVSKVCMQKYLFSESLKTNWEAKT